MLPIVVVLFVASSAFAAPSVSITQASINEIVPVRDNGKLVSSYLTDRVCELADGGDTNIYILTLQQILNDLANQPDAQSQALAVSQTIATLGELATGVPGDSCEAAALVNAYANSVSTGNTACLRQPLNQYIARMKTNIDLIVQLANNPNSVRYTVGPRANCAGGGRSYQFEAAWDAILAGASPYQIGLINEEYCATKRLYSALNVRSNNVGAAVSAASVPPVVQVVQNVIGPVANFLRTAVSGANASSAALAAKKALSECVANIRL